MSAIRRRPLACASVLAAGLWVSALGAAQERRVGSEHAVAQHLPDRDEPTLPIAALIEHGRALFSANWIDADGAGRPRMNGAGEAIGSEEAPLAGARAFNRVSGPDANSCRGCHNEPYSIPGGSGDFVTSGFETAERFSFVTFQRGLPAQPEVGGSNSSLARIGNVRATPGLFGAGFLELVARQMSRDLQRIRDGMRPGQSRPLETKGVGFGVLARAADGTWNTDGVEGLPPQSLSIDGGKPSLIVHPWRQSGSVASLREFTASSFHRHFGMQTTERFGADTDADGDGVVNELTRGDVTAVTAFQATLPVPGRVIPDDPSIERAVAAGERKFVEIGCARCHVPALTIESKGWVFTSNARGAGIDLTDATLPHPRLTPAPRSTVLDVPAYTDFKLHDITDPADADAADPVDMNHPPGTPRFTAGNRRFLTARLWGAGNQSPYFHHGQFTTMRQAILAHAGEALSERRAFEHLAAADKDAVIEFLKSLQVLPPGTRSLVVNEHGRAKRWPRGR